MNLTEIQPEVDIQRQASTRLRLRPVIFWTHLCLGVSAGLIVLVMCVTGVLLAYERQVLTWSDARSVRASGGQALPLDELMSRVREVQHAQPSTLTVRSDPSRAVEAGFGRERTLLVDPSTGQVLSDASPRLRAFFHRAEDFHRALGAQAERRNTGRIFTGVANLAFLFIVASGFYLWFPRKWSWSKIRGVVWFRGGLLGRARHFNWHNTAGAWCCIPLSIIVFSGVVMSYSWANNLLYRLTGNQPPAQLGGPPPERGPQAAGERRRHGPEAHGEQRSTALASVLEAAERVSPGWRSIALRMPSGDSQPVTAMVDFGNGGRPDKRTTLTISPSGSVLKTEAFANYNLGRRLRAWLRFLHTGEALGWAGQTIALLASAGGCLLVYTGLSLAYRRLFGRGI